ncbi:MAG: ATP-dependent RNA helicase SrmB [Bacteroidia bacterium]|jgi:ATP-dependent RNA helicase SrmB
MQTGQVRPIYPHLRVHCGTQKRLLNEQEARLVFEELGLDRRLQLGLDALEFAEPTEVQQAVVPQALQGVDLLVSAETGSGKTLAYLLPLAQRILASNDTTSTGTLALILVPTRELARQILKHARQLIDKTPLNAQAITGGADFKFQKALLRKDPEILIATPGRLLEHCERKSADLSCLQTLILDEADRMLDMGFREEVLKLCAFAHPKRQVQLLSATLSHRGVRNIASDLLHEPITVALGDMRQAHANIFHQRVLADSQEHKDQLLVALLNKGGFQRALVFANKRSTAQRLAGFIAYKGLRAAALHGELTTEERKKVVNQIQDNKIDILCASDVAARGLDVEGIDLVINYDMPHNGKDYLHRTGRTGRAGAKGLAITLVAAMEWNLMISIQRFLNTEFEPRSMPGLKARYAGPKKQKTSGKAAGSKKKKNKTTDPKAKARARDRKNTGKRRTNSKQANDGFAPPKKNLNQD